MLDLSSDLYNHDKEQINRATVAGGDVVITDEVAQAELAENAPDDVNTDPDAAQVITHSEVNAGTVYVSDVEIQMAEFYNEYRNDYQPDAVEEIEPQGDDPWEEDKEAWQKEIGGAYGVGDDEVYIYSPEESIAHNPAGTPLDEQINVKIGINGAEYVYNIETGQVVGGELGGTYNFITPNQDGFGPGHVGHGVVDFGPWVVWGAGPDDNSTFADRIEILTGQGF